MVSNTLNKTILVSTLMPKRLQIWQSPFRAGTLGFAFFFFKSPVPPPTKCLEDQIHLETGSLSNDSKSGQMSK